MQHKPTSIGKVIYCCVHVVSVLCLNVVQTGSSSLRASHTSSSSVSTQRSASMEERYTPARQVREYVMTSNTNLP